MHECADCAACFQSPEIMKMKSCADCHVEVRWASEVSGHAPCEVLFAKGLCHVSAAFLALLLKLHALG